MSDKMFVNGPTEDMAAKRDTATGGKAQPAMHPGVRDETDWTEPPPGENTKLREKEKQLAGLEPVDH